MISKFHRVSDILSTLMKGYGLAPKADEYRILKIWDGAVGDKISLHTQPSRLYRGILTVMVDSPAWMQQLTFYKEALIERINKGIGRDVIKDIRFKIGKVEKGRGKECLTPTPHLSPIQSEKIEGYLEPIKDIEVRKVVKKAIVKALRKEKENPL